MIMRFRVAREKARLRRSIESSLEARRIQERYGLGLGVPESVALAKAVRRSPRWLRRFRATCRRVGALVLMYTWALVVLGGALYFAVMLGVSVGRLITGDVP